jgi:hemerythrin-like domain-containing protein
MMEPAPGGIPTITDALRGEHGVLYALFDAVEGLLRDEPGDEELARLLGALLEPVLASHAGIEDGMLLAAFAGGDPGPLAAMEEEHRNIESLLGRLGRARRPADGSAGGREGESAGALLEELLDVARAHFEHEELGAFPFAEAHLDEATLRRLGADWADRRGVRPG